MTEQLDHNIFVDTNRNKEFVDAIINSGHKIELYRILNADGIPNKKIWMCLPQGDTFKLSFYTDNESIEYFTHEILHAYFITTLKFADTTEFYNELQVDEITENLLSRGLIGHINNVFAHEKFYKIYLDKNFSKENFTSDFSNQPVFYKNEIESEFNNKGVPNDSISYYISTYFSCVDCRSGLFDKEIETHFEFLKSKDNELFEILSTTWAKWLAESDVKKNKEIISDFIIRTRKWYPDRKINCA